MLVLILLIFISGFFILNFFKAEKSLIEVFSFSLLLGTVYHTLLSFVLACCGIYYSKNIFILFTLLLILITIFVSRFRKNIIKFKFDLNDIPVYYYLVIGYFLFRLISLALDSGIIYYHWDELRVYQLNAKQLFYTHDMKYYFSFFAPVINFVGTICHEFTGFTLTNPRIFSSIVFCNISLIIFKFLNESKVNKHLAALFSILFLISSGKALTVYRTFYTNVYYTSFLLVGVYLFLKYYFVEKCDDIPFLSYFFLLGALLVRREAFYHIVIFLLIADFYLLKRKKVDFKRLLIPALSFVIIFVLWIFIEGNYSEVSTILASGNSSSNLFGSNLTFINILSFITSAFNSLFSFDNFYLNYIISGMFVIHLIILMVMIIDKFKHKEVNKYYDLILFSFIFQIIYLGIVIFTSCFLFTEEEFVVAASFSRYMIMVFTISFVVVPIALFENTNFVRIGKRKEIVCVKNPKILLIIPAYNEEENILSTYKTIVDYNTKHKTNYDIIVINDGSSDSTGLICRDNSIPCINLVQNLGIGGAVQTGYKYALENDYDIAIQYDGDGQHDVSYVKKLVKELKNGEADIVIGSRFTGQLDSFKSTRLRRVGINVISMLIKITTGIHITDPTSGFRAVNKNVIAHLSNTYPKEFPEPESIVALIRRGYIVKEVPVKMKERIGGVSSIRMWKSAYYMINVCFSIIVTSIKKVGDC